MSKNSHPDARKQALTGQVIANLQSRLGVGKARKATRYAEQCFRRVPMEDLAAETPSTLATIVLRQLAFIGRRKPGEMLIRVYNPDPTADGWGSPHTIVEMVNDDMPFLVDTGALTLSEMGIGIHLIIHPVIRVGRDAEGRLTGIFDKSEGQGAAESVIQFQVDRRTSDKSLGEIEQRLVAAIGDARRAVADWKKMEASAIEAEQAMPEWAAGLDPEWIDECRAFLSWLLQDHFVLLGVRDYRVVRGGVAKGGAAYVLQRVEGSGLGILRESADTVRSRPLNSLAEAAWKGRQTTPLIITKTNARSTVHRAGYLDYIGVLKFDKQGRTIGERRFLGLFTSYAYNLAAADTPLVRVRMRKVLENSRLVPGSHAWKAMVHILETLPRDELLQASSSELQQTALGVLNLQERQRVRLFIRRERYGRFYSCLVYLPREQFNTENREKIQNILKRALQGARLDYSVKVSESPLARLHVIVRPRPDAAVEFDVLALEQKIVEAVRSWADELRAILVERLGEEQGLEYAARFGKSFPEAYKEDVSPWVAAFDLENVAAVDRGEEMRMELYRPRKTRGGVIRFKLFRKDSPIPLSQALPLLENLGLQIISERPYELHLPGEVSLWIQDFDMIPAVKRELDLDVIRERFQETFERALRGETDSDGFNRLVIASQMHWRQVKVLRAYCKYLLQTGVPFSASYMAETLARHPAIARLLIELFEAMFDPARGRESKHRVEGARNQLQRCFQTLVEGALGSDQVFGEFIDELVAARGQARETQVEAIRRAFRRALESVSSLDEDRTLFGFYKVIGATLRTNFYQLREDGEVKDYVSFKLDSQAVPDLPLPRPFREIWVYSPRFEGIHLRAGRIARGGLRWSDRREDFRTEVLGLMKAQNVKNTVIVPVGAKGGFVLKRAPENGGREAIQAEGIRCYKSFINGLLDITDNLDRDAVLRPADVVRYDDDDPYLVVAADKGTASFSDTANGVAAEHGFWLGDAFASGGSVGYDHKEMGITAKGAWEGVKRHFREMDMDIQKQPFTVVGIGDMSGDVFGNGMLLSRQIRLQAAFNHQHIFLDPNPDEKSSFRERQRLFRKRGSSWADYRTEVISAGGGVYSRLDKTIPLSPQVRAWLGVEEDHMTPNALIHELLRAPVDLLWNGGIGTYVKATAETHADVGDLANNALRVNGNELRCRVIGEGGNLGLTQRGRIEFARAGGRINTDFIDNSGGVDTSDHEVNIKILLNLATRAGKLGEDARRALMAEMADEVAQMVLRSNYLQTQAISMMEKFSISRLGSKQHFIHVLEDQGMLNRELEFLPSDEELQDRRDRGEGLTRPELAVLLSYSKISLYQQLLASDVPEDAWLSDEAVTYFPAPLRKRFAKLVPQHRLKREIIATQVTNSLVNRMGASFVMRMHEDTGATPGEVARAYTIAREVFRARDFWARVEALDNATDSNLQTTAMLAMWRLLRQATRWLLNLEGRRLDIRVMVQRLAPGLAVAEKVIRQSMSEEETLALEQQMLPYVEGGFSRPLAEQIAMLERLFPALDVVETAARRRSDVARIAQVFFSLGALLDLKWLRRQVEALQVVGQWHAMSRANLRDELFMHQNRLVERVLLSGGRKRDPVAVWAEANAERLAGMQKMLNHMKNHVEMDYPTIAVAVRSLGQLADDAAP
ncbi:MAG: NAD-glutamate dehydrogenase [Lysobacterales bacterium]|nr:MAG: NAD-glutamate dehydrogenase [Xanthomonadales bacterium]